MKKLTLDEVMAISCKLPDAVVDLLNAEATLEDKNWETDKWERSRLVTEVKMVVAALQDVVNDLTGGE